MYFYGQAKTLLFRQGTLVMEKGSSADTVTLQRSAGKPVSIVNDGIIRELNVPQVKDADPPVVTGNVVQSLREGSEADLSGAVLWDGEQLKEPSQSGGVYRVGSAAELAWIAAKIDDRSLGKISVLLTADIDLNNREWTPIGSYIPFSGTFDGGGHTISRLQIFEGAQNSGLFGQVQGAVIQNLQVQDAYLKNVGSNSGVLVGRAFGCTLQNCRVSEALIAADESAAAIGGLIGSAEDGILGLSRCTVSDTRISGYFSLGGLLGNCVVPEMTAAVVSSCRAEGVTVAAAPYDGNVKAWKGKHVQTHGFIGSVRADASRASFTVTGCSMEDCSTNADARRHDRRPGDQCLDGPGEPATYGYGKPPPGSGRRFRSRNRMQILPAPPGEGAMDKIDIRQAEIGFQKGIDDQRGNPLRPDPCDEEDKFPGKLYEHPDRQDPRDGIPLFLVRLAQVMEDQNGIPHKQDQGHHAMIPAGSARDADNGELRPEILTQQAHRQPACRDQKRPLQRAPRPDPARAKSRRNW